MYWDWYTVHAHYCVVLGGWLEFAVVQPFLLHPQVIQHSLVVSSPRGLLHSGLLKLIVGSTHTHTHTCYPHKQL